MYFLVTLFSCSLQLVCFFHCYLSVHFAFLLNIFDINNNNKSLKVPKKQKQNLVVLEDISKDRKWQNASQNFEGRSSI